LREEIRKKINYENTDPIRYRVFYESVELLPGEAKQEKKAGMRAGIDSRIP
jgi:hypothetical protein